MAILSPEPTSRPRWVSSEWYGMPASGCFLSAADIAGGERDIEELREGVGVFVEAFVEVAHAEQQKGICMFGFELEVLTTAWG